MVKITGKTLLIMDKKLNDTVNKIPPDKEIDPDEVVHEQQTIPDTSEEQDMDDLVHSIKQPETKALNEEQDIDDLMHEPDAGEEIDSSSSSE